MQRVYVAFLVLVVFVSVLVFSFGRNFLLNIQTNPNIKLSYPPKKYPLGISK